MRSLKYGCVFAFVFAFASVAQSIGSGLSAQIVEVEDDRGVTRTYLGLTTEDTGLIQIFGSDGRTATVQLSDDSDGGALVFNSQRGTGTVFLGSDKTGGDLFMFDEAGERRVAIGVGDTGVGIIELFDRNGVDAFEVNTDDDGGTVIVRSSDGDVAMALTVDEDGGVFTVRDNAGDVKIGLFINERGSGVIRLNGKSVGDVAEVFPLHTRTNLIPGTVVSMHGTGTGLLPSDGAYDPSVVGVISGASGLDAAMTIGSRDDGSSDLPVAMTGRAYVRVSASDGPVRVGDLLVASDQPGLAMRADDRSRALGAVVGKALENYAPGAEEEAMVLMLVMRL